MGKTAGKWIKTFLLGKKSSKSNLSKGRGFSKSVKKGEGLISSKVPTSNVTVDVPSILLPVAYDCSTVGVDSGKVVDPRLHNDGVSLSCGKEDSNRQENVNLSSQDSHERMRVEEAATKAQAAFRGYLARRAFRTLKGIIRLQALIRGHLVRRQAVSTLYCVQGIVKLQLLVRSRKDWHSDLRIQIHRTLNLGKYVGAIHVNSPQIDASDKPEKLLKNAFILKLLASSPTAMPLHLKYGSGEPNLAWEWLERWTRSRFWELLLQSKESFGPHSHTNPGGFQILEAEESRLKQGVRKQSSINVENGPSHSNSELDKVRRMQKKFSSHVDLSQGHQQTEIVKVKHNLRKVSDHSREVSDRLEVDNEKPKHALRKSSTSAAPSISPEKTNDVVGLISKEHDPKKNINLLVADELADKSNGEFSRDTQKVETNSGVANIPEMNTKSTAKDDDASNENQKASHRRASLPAKIGQQNGTSKTPRIPSYMAPTESAKAKLGGQCSPRLSRDLERNGLTRRHSLPSSTNGKLNSLSPSAQRLVQASGKGMIRSDKSLSSSRDCDKVTRVEWRR